MNSFVLSEKDKLLIKFINIVNNNFAKSSIDLELYYTSFLMLAFRFDVSSFINNFENNNIKWIYQDINYLLNKYKTDYRKCFGIELNKSVESKARVADLCSVINESYISYNIYETLYLVGSEMARLNKQMLSIPIKYVANVGNHLIPNSPFKCLRKNNLHLYSNKYIYFDDKNYYKYREKKLIVLE